MVLRTRVDAAVLIDPNAAVFEVRGEVQLLVLGAERQEPAQLGARQIARIARSFARRVSAYAVRAAEGEVLRGVEIVECILAAGREQEIRAVVEVLAAQDALTVFNNDLNGLNAGKTRMHVLYEDNEALGAAIDQLYAKLQEQAADPMKMGAVQGQYGQFNSADTIIGNLSYNQAVYDYQNEVGGFPANVLGGLFGVREVEPFA